MAYKKRLIAETPRFYDRRAGILLLFYHLKIFRFPGVGCVILDIRCEIISRRMPPGMLLEPLDAAGNALTDSVATRSVEEGRILNSRTELFLDPVERIPIDPRKG